MVDQMIQGQLGSLTHSTPSAPSWEAKHEVDRMEEGKKPEELVPMYVEGRSVQASSFGSIWSRHRGPVLVGALLLLSLVVLLGSSLGRSTEEGGSSSAAMKTMDMPASHGTHLEPADGSTPTAPDTAAADVATSPEPMNVDAAAAAAQPAAAEVVEEAMPNATEDAGGNQTGTQTASDQAMASYKASCPTLLKLHGACDYDLSIDDRSLDPQTFVRNVCPAECEVVDRYRKMCPSLLKLDGGCAHDLSVEEDILPRGTYVRLVCPERCTIPTTTTASTTVPTETTSQELRTSATSTIAPTSASLFAGGLAPGPERAQISQPEIQIPGKAHPSRWLGYVAGLGTTAAWVALCIREQRASPLSRSALPS
ncbi:KLHL8 [Symbiodinium natans]|uniref:KLHL8 protein n=1 Tax=Symbiodinium natans TaxID=878477 RepID=A0A812Q5W6_9DINO|nr:KLHL8 [Symbiodinium natans]